MITRQILDSYLNHTITDICPHGYNPANNCAHFVSHVLQMSFGLTCASMTNNRGLGAGANVRVKEIFDRCPEKRELLACPAYGESLLFVSASSSFSNSPVQIANVSKKHIGILLNGNVWHYSNSQKKVICQTAGEFLSHYRGQINSLWLGSFPVASRPAYFGTCSIAV